MDLDAVAAFEYADEDEHKAYGLGMILGTEKVETLNELFGNTPRSHLKDKLHLIPIWGGHFWRGYCDQQAWIGTAHRVFRNRDRFGRKAGDSETHDVPKFILAHEQRLMDLFVEFLEGECWQRRLPFDDM